MKRKIIYLIIDNEPHDLIVGESLSSSQKRINSLKRINQSYDKALDYLKQDPSIENLKHYPRMDLVKLSKAHPEILDAYLTYSMINKRKQILNSYSDAGYDPFDFYHLG
jgi:hypothetical protein